MNKPADYSSIPIGKTLSPGALLRAKREEYGWALTDVAQALRLSDRQVEFIEADDYANLPGKTYVMGYWRSYSQLLKISIDESIQIHRADLGAFTTDFTFESPAKEANGHEENSRKRAAVLFAILLAVVLGAIWYWQNPNLSVAGWIDSSLQSLRSATVPSPEPIGEVSRPEPILDDEIAGDVVEGALDGSSQPGVQIDGVVDLRAGDGLNGEQAGSVLALPVPNFAEDQNAVEINTLGYSILIAELPLSRRDLVYLQAEPAADAVARADGKKKSQPKAASVAQVQNTVKKKVIQPVSAQPVATSAATAGGNSRIVFNVAKESWIDVRDSTGERLIYRTVNRGEAISLKGAPPYSVFIGSAEGVTVQYQGKRVPFKAHESGLFARFEVGR